jgi:hypothetical protein
MFRRPHIDGRGILRWQPNQFWTVSLNPLIPRKIKDDVHWAVSTWYVKIPLLRTPIKASERSSAR